MGIRFEWFRASMTEASYVPAGCDIRTGEPETGDEFDDDSHTSSGALVVALDEASVFEGTPSELHAFVERLRGVLPDIAEERECGSGEGH